MKFNSKMVQKTVDYITKHHGNPNRIEMDNNKNVTKMTWHNIEGCDGVVVKGDIKYKWHPIPAVTYVYAYKFMPVPEKLQGPLMYASETIGVDYIDIPEKESKNYYKTGEKMLAKVSGACASITISVITIKFVEDMIKKYQDTNYDLNYLSQVFRQEYDQRILNYLCGKGIKPEISWFPNQAEAEMIDGPFKKGKYPSQCNSI